MRSGHLRLLQTLMKAHRVRYFSQVAFLGPTPTLTACSKRNAEVSKHAMSLAQTTLSVSLSKRQVDISKPKSKGQKFPTAGSWSCYTPSIQGQEGYQHTAWFWFVS